MYSMSAAPRRSKRRTVGKKTASSALGNGGDSAARPAGPISPVHAAPFREDVNPYHISGAQTVPPLNVFWSPGKNLSHH